MANTYLTRTLSGNGNGQIFTLSCWIKRSKINDYGQIFSMGTGTADGFNFGFNNSNKLLFESWDGSTNPKIETNRLFRDISAFYHLVLAVDTTQGTEANRVKIYVNGVQETSLATSTYPAQNYTFPGTNQSSDIAKVGYTTLAGSWTYFDGVMSHIHWIDGTQYAASTFGSTDSTTGEWTINTSPSATYGTNGFFILKDGNTITDSSSNSNNFALAQGTLTKTEDCPDNNFATGNPLYFTNSAWTSSLTNGNNTFTGHTGTNSYPTLASTIAMPSSGKFYTEFKLTSSSAYIYCGIATPECVSGTAINAHYPNYDNEGGSNANAYSLWGNNGQKYVKENGGASTASNYGSGLSQNDIIQVACDLDNNKLYIGKNGTYFNSGVPTSGSTGTGAITILNNEYLMFMCDGGQSTDASGQANFGNGYFGTTAVASAGTAPSEGGIFEYDCPSGYQALCTKGINSF